MKLSARNVIRGTVREIDMNAVNADVTVEIAPGVEMSSIITKKSCESLELKPGKKVYLIIKASSVIIGAD